MKLACHTFLFIFLAGCAAPARPNYAARFVSTVSTAKCVAWGTQGDVSAAMCAADGSVFFCTATSTSVPKCEAVSGPARAARPVAQPAMPQTTDSPKHTDDPPSPPHHADSERHRP